MMPIKMNEKKMRAKKRAKRGKVELAKFIAKELNKDPEYRVAESHGTIIPEITVRNAHPAVQKVGGIMTLGGIIGMVILFIITAMVRIESPEPIVNSLFIDMFPIFIMLMVAGLAIVMYAEFKGVEAADVYGYGDGEYAIDVYSRKTGRKIHDILEGTEWERRNIEIKLY